MSDDITRFEWAVESESTSSGLSTTGESVVLNPFAIAKEVDPFIRHKTKIVICGVGGCGGNVLNGLIGLGIKQHCDVDLVAINTDPQDLDKNNAEYKIQIGRKESDGNGAGKDPEVGRRSAEESLDDIKSMLEGKSMLFLIAGMGGGTGTGASPVIAKLAKELKLLTVAIVTLPETIEGASAERWASVGVQELYKHVDCLMKLDNNKMVTFNKSASMDDCYAYVNSYIYDAIVGIALVLNNRGLNNVDFADLSKLMVNGGAAIWGMGKAVGDNRITEAIEKVVKCPFFPDSTKLNGAKGVLLSFILHDTKFLPAQGRREAMDMLNRLAYPDESDKKRMDPVVLGVMGLPEKVKEDQEMWVVVAMVGLEDELNPRTLVGDQDASGVRDFTSRAASRMINSRERSTGTLQAVLPSNDRNQEVVQRPLSETSPSSTRLTFTGLEIPLVELRKTDVPAQDVSKNIAQSKYIRESKSGTPSVSTPVGASESKNQEKIFPPRPEFLRMRSNRGGRNRPNLPQPEAEEE